MEVVFISPVVSSIISYLFTKNFFGLEPLFSSKIGEIDSINHFPFFIISGRIIRGQKKLDFMFVGHSLGNDNMFLRLIILICFISFYVTVSKAGLAKSSNSFVVYSQTEEWSVVKTSGKKANFTGCWASPKEKNSVSTFAIGLNAQRKLTFIIAAKQWRLTRTKYPISFQVDDNFPITSQLITSKDKTGGVIVVAPQKQMWNELKAGNLLKIYGKKAKFNLSLKGSAKALSLVNNCWAFASSFNQKPLLDPFSEGTDQASKNGSKKPVQKTKKNWAVAISKGIINNLEDSRFKLYTHVPKDLKDIGEEISWEALEGVGSARNVIKMFDKDVLQKILGKTDKKACSGAYAIKAKNQSLSNGGNSVVIYSGCEENKDTSVPVYVVYRYYPLKSGQAMRITHMSITPQGSRESDKIFFNKLNSFLEK